MTKVAGDGENVLSWEVMPSVKERNAAQRAATELLDALAPEEELPRGRRAPLRVMTHRTPSGCILQGDSAALSVSWYSDPSAASPLGELHVVVWSGSVTRRGAPPPRAGGKQAELVTRLVCFPVEGQVAGVLVWRDTAGAEQTTAELAARCRTLFEEQLAKGS